jgi:hypothetical protein
MEKYHRSQFVINSSEIYENEARIVPMEAALPRPNQAHKMKKRKKAPRDVS